jgi:hypothetical protein
MADGAADLAKSLTRNYDDFEKQTTRAQQDNDKSLKRGAQDHQIALTQSEQDFKKNMSRETTDFDKTLLRDSQDLSTSLKNEAIDFNTQMSNSQDDFDKQMARMQTDFQTEQANAKTDHATTLSDMHQDFTITMQNAVTDHGLALSQMTDQYKTAQQRAGQDLQTSFTDYTGGLNSTIIQMTDIATGWMKQYGGTATQLYLNSVIDSLQIAAAAAGLAVPPSTTAGATNANTGNGPPGYTHQTPSSAAGGTGSGAAAGKGAHATGGVFLSPQFASVSEQGPEMLLPLNTSGQQFMAKLFAAAVKDAATDPAFNLTAHHGGSQVSTMPILSRAIADGLIKAGRQSGGKVSIGGPVGDWRSGGYAATQPGTHSLNMPPQDKAFFTQLIETSTREVVKIIDAGGRVQAKDDMMLMKEVSVLGKEIVGNMRSDTELAMVITKTLAREIVTAIAHDTADTVKAIQRNDNSMSFAGAQFKIVAQDVNSMAKQLQAKAKLAKLTNPKK